jgi:glycosyltransferase involved in cell wall biosynthesis
VRDVAAPAGITVLVPEEDADPSPYPPLAGADVRHYRRGRYGRVRSRLILNPASRAARGPGLEAGVAALPRSLGTGGGAWLVCDTAYLAAPVLRLAARTGARVVYSSHNCEASVWRQLMASAKGPWRRLETWLGLREIAAQERALLQRASAVWCCSESDLRLLSKLARHLGDTSLVVPNGVNGDVVRLQPAKSAERGHMCFVGYLGTEASHEACTYLVRDVMPRVHALLPDARLTLAGRDARPELRAMVGPGVSVVSPLVDPNETLAAASLSVVPLLQGGGTRLKILESLAAGRPVVATTKGAEGLDLARLSGVTVSDGAGALADAIVSELRREPSQHRAESLRERVLGTYSWTAITLRLRADMAARFGDPWR